MKHNKRLFPISLLVFGLLLAAEIRLGAGMAQLDMLPEHYFSMFLAAMGAATLLVTGLLFFRRKKAGLFRQLLGWLLAVALSLGCLIAGEAVTKVNNTISSVTDIPTISAIVDVYVRAEDPAQTLADTREYTFAVTEVYDRENTAKALDALQEELGGEITTVTYPTVFAMIDALYAGEADALLLNSAFLDILSELEAYAGFQEAARSIFSCTITETPPQTEPTEPSAPPETVPTTSPETVPGTEPGNRETQAPTVPQTQPAVPENPPFLVYLSGSDTRSKLLTTSRNDVNVIAVVNPQTRQILLVNTPRDYYIGNPAGGGAKDKLTHCGIYGIECSIQTLENLYSADIAYYAQINFSGFETLIDAIGGVTVYSEVSFITTHGQYPIYAGENHLNGNQALCFARERYSLAGGDNDRGKNHMKLISAFIDKLSAETIISRYADILDSLQGMFVTNMPQSDISRLVKMQLSDMRDWNVLSYAVTGTGGFDIPFSMPGIYAYVTYPDEQSVAFASALISRVLAGEILTQDDLVRNQPPV